MKTIKIIDLLNKIAKGEEDDIITEFEFDKRIWNFKALNDSEFCLDGWLLNQDITITKYKETLKEEKKLPEKIPEDLFEDYTKTAKIYQLYKLTNEIIDYLESKEKGE